MGLYVDIVACSDTFFLTAHVCCTIIALRPQKLNVQSFIFVELKYCLHNLFSLYVAYIDKLKKFFLYVVLAVNETKAK